MTRINIHTDPLLQAICREHDEFHQAWLAGGKHRNIPEFAEEFSRQYGERYGVSSRLSHSREVSRLLRVYHYCTDRAFSPDLEKILRQWGRDSRDIFSGEIPQINMMIRCYKRWTSSHILILEETHDP